MPSTLIDTNVLLDVFEDRHPWVEWSIKQFRILADSGALVINQIIYAEASVPYKSLAAFEETVGVDWLKREDVPWIAAFVAGKAHLAYREKRGEKSSVLPDFLIGAHASVKGYRLLTRDAARIRTYFPEVEIIAPDTHP